MFESDFESTDEEAAKVDKSTGEQTIQEEEMRVRKVHYLNVLLESCSPIECRRLAQNSKGPLP